MADPVWPTGVRDHALAVETQNKRRGGKESGGYFSSFEQYKPEVRAFPGGSWQADVVQIANFSSNQCVYRNDALDIE